MEDDYWKHPIYPIVVTLPNGKTRSGMYRWLYYGEPGATGMTLKIVAWDDEMPEEQEYNENQERIRNEEDSDLGRD